MHFSRVNLSTEQRLRLPLSFIDIKNVEIGKWSIFISAAEKIGSSLGIG
jgi:hypothetical protein